MFGSPIPGLPSMSPIPASPLPSCFLLFIRCGTVKGRRELGHRKASAPLGWRLYRYATVRDPRYSRGRKIMEGPDKGISPMEMAAREIAARLRESGHVAYLAGGCVRDIVRGDIEAKLVRAIGDAAQRFAEDRLRMLRAVRFATVLDYKIDDQTWEALVAKAVSINEISAERIREELVRIFLSPNRVRGWDF